MTTSERIISEALTLPPTDRLTVLEHLWDSLAETPDALGLSDAQRPELDRRIEEMDANPSAGIPWADVKAELHRGRRVVVSAAALDASGNRL